MDGILPDRLSITLSISKSSNISHTNDCDRSHFQTQRVEIRRVGEYFLLTGTGDVVEL